MRAPWRETAGGLEVRVRVTPRARRAAVTAPRAGREDAALRVSVREAPADGAANEAVRRALAEALGCPPSAVTLLRGATGRDKTFAVAGDPFALAARLAEIPE
jgi:uncharacterized protein YggU (UPF0235/DUF167 family)